MENFTNIQHIIAKHKTTLGGLLPMLHDIQNSLGFIPTNAVLDIATALNISRAEVHGVMTYYHHFRTTPVKGSLVQVCRAEACQSMGAESLWQHACKKHGAKHTVEAVYCLGLCANSPAMLVNHKPVTHVSADGLDDMLNQKDTSNTKVSI